MDKVRQDIAYALRTMRRNPLATAVIVLTLAIGIGASTAVFTLVDAVLVRKLPYRDPDRLVAVWLQPKSQPDVKMFAPYRDLQALREHAESFEDVAANSWAFAGQTLMWRGEPHRVIAIPSTQNLFALLGAKAARGRTFLADDLSSGCSVERIFQKFFGNRSRALDNFASGDLVGDMLGKKSDAIHTPTVARRTEKERARFSV